MLKSKRIRLFAGPNGSGKTTLFTEFSHRYETGSFVNADFIEKELSEKGLYDLQPFGLNVSPEDLETFMRTPEAISLEMKAKSENFEITIEIRENSIVNPFGKTNSYEAAFTATFIRSLLIRNGISFSFETVMSHPSKLEEMRKAKEQGYRIYLYFVCTDNPEINVSRIKNRVIKGGHDVESDRVMSRYRNTLKNVYAIIELSYRAYLFDNSGKGEQRLIAEVFQGDLELTTDEPPQWFVNYILPHFS